MPLAAISSGDARVGDQGVEKPGVSRSDRNVEIAPAVMLNVVSATDLKSQDAH